MHSQIFYFFAVKNTFHCILFLFCILKIIVEGVNDMFYPCFLGDSYTRVYTRVRVHAYTHSFLTRTRMLLTRTRTRIRLFSLEARNAKTVPFAHSTTPYFVGGIFVAQARKIRGTERSAIRPGTTRSRLAPL